MKRFLSVVLVFALIFSLSAPLTSAVEDPDLTVHVNGTAGSAKFGNRDTLDLEWLFLEMGLQPTLRNTQGMRLAYDKTVLQLIRWDATSAFDESAWSATFVNCPGAASPDDGVYPYNFSVSAAQNTAGTIGYINMTFGDPIETFTSFYSYTKLSLMKVRFAFREGKSAEDLRADSIRCMTAAELLMTGQTSAVSMVTDDGTVYAYLNQAGYDLLNEPEFTFPGSTIVGPSLTLSAASWNPMAAGGSTNVTVTSDISSWTASSSATSWLTVSPTSGSNNGTITLNAAANTGTSIRTGVITVTGGGVSKSITVTQAGTATTTGPIASISAPSAYGITSTLTYTISLDNELIGINQFTITAQFDPNMLDFANESEILIPEGSFITENWNPDTGEYKAWIVLMSNGSLFTASSIEPMLKVKFNVIGSGSDIAGTLTGVKVTEVVSSTDAQTITCELAPAEAVSKYLPYDFNGDGKIDMEDISLIIYNYYMVGTGSPKWEQAKVFDTNGDSRIDMLDIMMIASYITF